MAKNVTIPSMGESVTEAVLLRWMKADGDRVQVDDPLCELETDKANVELPSPIAGVFRRVKKEGDTVRVGETIAQIDDAGPGASKTAPATAKPPVAAPEKSVAPARPPQDRPASASRTDAKEDLSPSVRRLIDENRLDPRSIPPSGPGGRLLKEDVLTHLESKGGKAAPMSPGFTGAASGGMGLSTSGSAPSSEGFTFPPLARDGGSNEPLFDNEGIQRQPMTKIRKKIAERLVASQQQTAMLTTFNEIDMSAVLALRAKYKERFQETYGVGLGLMSFFARAVVQALKHQPIVNASIDGSDIVFHDHVHLGIAVSTERGLIVPVLRHAEKLSMAKVESEIKRMAVAAREGKLGLQELSGGTFTITNGGVFGSLLSTPILNSPQSAILGMHAIQKRPIAVGDKVEVHPMMYVALSYDHRLIDGKDSVTFLVRIKELLEDPARLMLEV